MRANSIDRVDELPTPALLLDLDRLERNLAHMARRADRLGVALRPHVKTHKCVEIAELQRDHGASGLTVSTLREAEIFAAAGFDDITWAFPLILSRLDQAVALARRVRLGVVVDSDVAVEALVAAGVEIRVWLKVDCGYHRAGVDPGSDEAARLAEAIVAAPALRFAGILSHSGQAYEARGRERLAVVAEAERRVMVGVAQRLRDRGIEVPGVSVGSTPAMSAVRDLDGVTEARPGVYALFDLMQAEIGACEIADCALSVAASVVSRQPRHAVIDAGALALSKDAGGADSTPGYGAVYADYEGAVLDEMGITSLSQEHGRVDRPLPVGTRLRILPNHACLTVACFDEFAVVRGERVVGRWPVRRER